MESGVRFGPLGPETAHLCVDMQNLFAPGGPWGAPWLETTLPRIVQLTEAMPERSFFTRFIPPVSKFDLPGSWARYYGAWPQIRRDALTPQLLALVPPLERLARPRRVFDKCVYSPWGRGRLEAALVGRGVNTLIVSGGETDICVLATVLGAVDLGFRVIVATDAVCSSADDTHDAVLTLLRARLGHQVETAEVAQILAHCRIAA